MKYSANNFFKFCPRCGEAYRRQNRKGILACAHCKFQFFQNSKPTASALFEDRFGRVLLVKRAVDPKKGWWDTPGGFLDDGESPIAGLRREIKEELGVTLADIRFFGMYIDIYRYGYDVYTLNVVYLAKINSGRLVAKDDVSAYRWFAPKDIPTKQLGFPWLKPALKDWIRSRK